MPDTTQTIQLAIKATPEDIWSALVDGARTPGYYIGYEAHFDLHAGRPYAYTAGDRDVITGKVLEVKPAELLRTTFNGHWAPDVDALPESVVTFALFEPFMPMPGVTFLSCTHEGLPETEAAAHLEIGWVSILSGLKTLLETGAPLTSTSAGAPTGAAERPAAS